MNKKKYDDKTRKEIKLRRSRIDITGQIFGKLTVLRPDLTRHGAWICLCECGTEKSVLSGHLRSGSTQSCGCQSHVRVGRVEPGAVFGYLTVLKKVGDGKVLVQCGCGTEKIVESSNLLRGAPSSCGCLTKAIVRSNNIRNKPPGVSARNTIFSSYRTGALKRDLLWNLTYEQVVDIIESDCFYCGRPPFNEKKVYDGSIYKYNGIDRVDNALGYEIYNVVPSCIICNIAKMDLTQEEFLSLCREIARRHPPKFIVDKNAA